MCPSGCVVSKSQLLLLLIQYILSNTGKTSSLICYIDIEKINLVKAQANSVSYQFFTN